MRGSRKKSSEHPSRRTCRRRRRSRPRPPRKRLKSKVRTPRRPHRSRNQRWRHRPRLRRLTRAPPRSPRLPLAASSRRPFDCESRRAARRRGRHRLLLRVLWCRRARRRRDSPSRHGRPRPRGPRPRRPRVPLRRLRWPHGRRHGQARFGRRTSLRCLQVDLVRCRHIPCGPPPPGCRHDPAALAVRECLLNPRVHLLADRRHVRPDRGAIVGLRGVPWQPLRPLLHRRSRARSRWLRG
jgi:hypothetical protein